MVLLRIQVFRDVTLCLLAAGSPRSFTMLGTPKHHLNSTVIFFHIYTIYDWLVHRSTKIVTSILCLWFRASLIYINNCPTRCNTKQSIYCSASSLYMFRVSTTPIIRSTQNFNYSLWYSKLTWPRWREVVAQKNMTSTGGCT